MNRDIYIQSISYGTLTDRIIQWLSINDVPVTRNMLNRFIEQLFITDFMTIDNVHENDFFVGNPEMLVAYRNVVDIIFTYLNDDYSIYKLNVVTLGRKNLKLSILTEE